jgi:hypothetical protein
MKGKEDKDIIVTDDIIPPFPIASMQRIYLNPSKVNPSTPRPEVSGREKCGVKYGVTH